MHILLNDYCNLRCPYCFAVDYLRHTNRRSMLRDDFATILQFFMQSRRKFVSLAGGEPTLHPEFRDFVQLAVDSGFEKVFVITNGLFNTIIREYLHSVGSVLSLVWNINQPAFYTPGQWTLLRSNLACLVARESSVFGVNISDLNADPSYLLPLCEEFPPACVRYGFAHQGGGNTNVETIEPTRWCDFTPAIARFVTELGGIGVRSRLDCGFVPCVWEDTDLGKILRYSERVVGCTLPLSIDPDLVIRRCWRVTDKHLTDFRSLQDANRFFAGEPRDSDSRLFKQCGDCVLHRIGTCDGGCLGDRTALARGRFGRPQSA